MKPNGLTVGLRVVHPTRVEDAVWQAVQEAVIAGWDVSRFRRECAEAWNHELEEERRLAKHEWEAK